MSVFYLKMILLYSFAKNWLCGCPNHADSIKSSNLQICKTATLDTLIDESSGLVFYSDSVLLTHNDNGNTLFWISNKGKLLKTQELPAQTDFKDWEEIAYVPDTDLLLAGDFGNNANRRKDLNIQVFDLSENKFVGKINFSYKNQTQFPPTDQKRNFDCEAMVVYKNKIWLFSKNRSKSFVYMYELAFNYGSHIQLTPLDSFDLPGKITAACLDRTASKIALLSYGNLYFLDIDTVLAKPKHDVRCIKLHKGRQNESVAFGKKNQIYITNEQRDMFVICNIFTNPSQRVTSKTNQKSIF